MGDGHRVNTQAKCTGLTLQLGEFDIVLDAFVLKLGGVDVILGVEWLKTLGKVVMDWEHMTMEFQKEGQNVLIQAKADFPVMMGKNKDRERGLRDFCGQFRCKQGLRMRLVICLGSNKLNCQGCWNNLMGFFKH